ncbi:response regulator [Brucella endophytica]|uniref:Response regulator n=2 Tax=Brucella endophytica TaxID=1963359 RepID=A0A916S4E3_9HYPH|nr:response regulator [Brucella endophytica]
MLIEDNLLDMGHEVAAMASRLTPALDLARTGSFDVAILDVNLDGEPSYPIADVLRERGIPMIFASGYGPSGLDPNYAGTPILTKPFIAADLEKALLNVTGRV